VFISHTTQNEQVVDFGCTHQMDKDASLFTYLDKYVEQKNYVVNYFSLNIVGCGDVPCRHEKIVNVYHALNLSENLLSDSQWKKKGKIVEFRLYFFFVRDLKNGQCIFARGFLNPKDGLYNFCNST
jgi:hypothetical protein